MKTNRLHLMVFMAVSAMVFCACDNGQQPLIITENGVGPFMLDSSFLNIPPRSSFYDTILLNRFYTVLIASERFDKEENKLEKDLLYDKIDGCYGTGTVMRGKDTLMVVKYNEEATIYSVEILSDKFKLSNGIRVGMSSPEIFEKYNARFLEIRNFHGRVFHCFDIPNLINNITIMSNHFLGAPDEMVAEIGDSQVLSVSFDNIRDQHVKSILIARDYYNFIHSLSGKKNDLSEANAITSSQKGISNVVSNEVPSEALMGEQDENYKAAIRAQMSGLKKMAKVVKNGGFGDKGEFLKWMQGTWIWREQIPNHGTHLYRLVVNGEIITSYFDDSMDDKGEIKYYDVENGYLTFGDRSEVAFDNERRIIYLSVTREEGKVYERQTSSPNNTSRRSSSYSRSSSDSRGAQYSPLRARYDKLNEEATKIVEDFEKSLRAGGIAYCMLLANQLRDINDEKISIARQLGDPELLRVSIYQKNQSEAAMRQLGL